VSKSPPRKGAYSTKSAARRVRERAVGPVLIDTSVLLWWLTDPTRLSRAARTYLLSPTQSVLLSAVSLWEIGSKVRRGLIVLPAPFVVFVETIQLMGNVEIVAADLPVWLGVVDLDWKHRDPADRILVATAQRYRVPLITSDRAIREFYPDAIW
jgi:PIN domain nuclease of toxin-antitoxin system